MGDPTEAALIVSSLKAAPPSRSPSGHLEGAGERVTEIPFSSERKRMSVVLKKDGSYLVYTKGAVEIVLEKCSKLYKNGKEVSLSALEKKKLLDVNHELSTQALRNLGFAYKTLTVKEYGEQAKDEEGKKLEQDLIFIGIQAMMDPPRIEVKPLIAQCLESGIRVIMITGDHGATAQAVAHEIGIVGDVLTGEDLDKMKDEEFAQVIQKISVYARVNPGTKMRIVEGLKKKGHIVAMTGDGVNDAPALKKADIGIAMGITGTDVAKEASDMVLLDDKFSTIISAIEEGRGIFHNIRKFVMYLLSCNIAEVIVVFVGVMVFQELLLTATMLLWINVVTDGIPAVALGLDPAEKGIMRYSPKVFQTEIISRKMWLEMAVGGLLLSVLLVIWYYLRLPEGLAFAQSTIFTSIVIFELVVLYIIRSAYRTGIFSNIWLFISVAFTILIQVVIVYTPSLAHIFELKQIDSWDWIYIVFASIWLLLALKLVRILLADRSVQSK